MAKVSGRFKATKGVLYELRSKERVRTVLESAGEDVSKIAERNASSHPAYDPDRTSYPVRSYQGKKLPYGRWQVWVQAEGYPAWAAERDDGALTKAVAEAQSRHGYVAGKRTGGKK